MTALNPLVSANRSWEPWRWLELGRKRSLIYCHVSLPCTGGSPLLNFSKPSVREHHQATFLNLLSSLGGYLHGIKRLDPKASDYFSSYLIRINIGDLIWWEVSGKNGNYSIVGVAAGCRTGLCTSQGIPIGKRYRIVSENQEVARSCTSAF